MRASAQSACTPTTRSPSYRTSSTDDEHRVRRSLPEDFVPRVMCARCRRPERVCFCSRLPSIETKTRIVLLQHPRERDMAIGTARMASLCLPSSELHVGVDFRDSPELARALDDPNRHAALLYPGTDAIDVLAHP